MQFKQSQTYQNLLEAFQEKCRLSVCHQLYAQKAEQEGLRQITKYFLETAKHETNHATILNGLIEQEMDTIHNLKHSIEQEHVQWSDMYQNFAEIASTEGYEQIAAQFENIARIDKNHEARFEKLLFNVENEEIYEKPFKASWICSCCGYSIYHRDAPLYCPLCHSSIDCFELENHNY